ncbi:MAG: hypothetical protein WC389_22190 [Lutibacter sp.]
MKKLLLIILLLFSGISMFGQFSLAPSKGDRFGFYLDGDVWNTDLSYCKSVPKFAIHVFISPDGWTSVWFQNFYLTQNHLQKLIDYIDSRPELTVYSIQMESVGSSKISTFDIYKKPSDTLNYTSLEPPDIFYLMKEIRKFQNKKK